MVEDLLFITKNLLAQSESSKFSQAERDYIIRVVRQAVFILLIEFSKSNN